MGSFPAKVITGEFSFKYDCNEPCLSAERWESKRYPICINNLSSKRIASLGEVEAGMQGENGYILLLMMS